MNRSRIEELSKCKLISPNRFGEDSKFKSRHSDIHHLKLRENRSVSGAVSSVESERGGSQKMLAKANKEKQLKLLGEKLDKELK